MMRLVLALVATVVSGDGHAATNTCANEDAIPVILDIDPNIDDVLALAYLAKEGTYDIKAVIVTATGFTNPSAGVEIVYRELEMLGLSDVDVGVGPLYPTGCNIFAGNPDGTCDQMRVVNQMDHWRLDTMYGVKITHLPYSDRYTTYFDNDGTATNPEDSAEIYKKHIDNGVTMVITCGPLTSLGGFYQTYPESFAKITKLYSMLGNVDVLGNVYTVPGNDVAEFNVLADVTGSAMIVNSSISEIRLVTLDGTNFVPTTRDWLDAISAIETPEAEFIYALTAKARDNWFSGPDGFFGENADGTITNESLADGYFLWDPLAAVLSVHPEWGNWAMEKLSVTVSSPIDLDNDGEFIRDENGNEVYFTTSVSAANADAVRDDIISVLERDCISNQPIPLARMAAVYEMLAPRYGYIENNRWIPESCDEGTPCPEGYECVDELPLRRANRKLRFGYSEKEVRVCNKL